jgi:hypothetical protein
MTIDLFTASRSDLERLDQKSGIEFIANLLWAESRRINIPVSNISISYDVNVPDGGIDAQVDANTKPQGDMIIDNLSCYQIKTGKNFLPQEESQIRKELFGSRRTIKRDNLGEKVRDCLEKNGTYVLVCLHKVLNTSQIGKAEGHLRRYFESCGYHKMRVLLIDQTKIIGILKRYPSLALALKGINVNFQTHYGWSNSEQMRKKFVQGKIHANKMDKIRESLRDSLESAHVRLLGEPGIGN